MNGLEILRRAGIAYELTRRRPVPPRDPFELPTQEEAQTPGPQPEDDGEPYPHDAIVFGNGWNMS